MYMLVANVLVDMLPKVIDSLIYTNSSTFIKGRQLVDGVVVVEEVIDLAKMFAKNNVLSLRLVLKKSTILSAKIIRQLPCKVLRLDND